ncbi:MarR family winged helix-turn-helix transcriptional regulator [Dysosmobacter sp.]
MDASRRQITKIAREAGKLTVRMMKETGIGSGEFDLIHAVRHHPGATQKEIGELLNMDKGAVARRAASLESKGYLLRRPSPADGRIRLLYATQQAESLKKSKTVIESAFYEWLLEGLAPDEQETFAALLETLYHRSKQESRAGFPHVLARLEEAEP